MLRLTFSFIVTISSNIQKLLIVAPLPSEDPDDDHLTVENVSCGIFYVFQRGDVIV